MAFRRQNDRIHIIMACLLLLCVLVGVGFFLKKKTSVSTDASPQKVVSLHTYDSAEDGITFVYKDSYTLEERQLDFNDITGKYISFVPVGATLPDAGEGPPTITIEIFNNPKKIPLSAWLQKITSGTPAPLKGWDYAEGKVGGEDATLYSASGLYESDNVAVAHGTRVYVFSATWISRSDVALSDLEALLTSVHFK